MRYNICFQWEWDRAKEIYPNWRDGLRACMENINKKHNVDWLLYEIPKKEYDWILTWCDSNSQFSRFYSQYKSKRGIFLTTNPANYHNLEGFDVIFCESSVVYNEARMRGLRAVKAFGTDDKFYKPSKVKKDIPYFYPATFSPWKRQEDIIYLGKDLLCVGTVQPDGELQHASCVESGVKCEVGYFPPEKIRDYYQRAKEVIIPAQHGSERTVLEAMSCDILPSVINLHNRKALTYIDEFRRSGLLSPREFILKNYSAKKYADTVLKALYEVDHDYTVL
jgi:hypothetical protein